MRRPTSYLLILLSLIIAGIFMQVPLPSIIAKARPDFFLLILMYWWLAQPDRVGIFTGFCVGIVLDVLQGAALGQHTLGIVLVGWVMLKNYQRIRVMPLTQQAIIIGALLLFKQLIVFWVNSIRGVDNVPFWVYPIPSILGGLLWPWLFILMRDLRRKAIK